MTSPPLVLEIKENSLDDGPGIRSVVFFKGSPLGCAWCHNPESRRRCVELSYDAAECLSTCDACMRACPQDAITRERPSFLDRERCDLCLACVRVCPSEALTQVGTEMDVRDIVRRVLRDKAFYDTSGGGVTLSGNPGSGGGSISAALVRPPANSSHVSGDPSGIGEGQSRILIPGVRSWASLAASLAHGHFPKSFQQGMLPWLLLPPQTDSEH